jgi:hypothetical protein
MKRVLITSFWVLLFEAVWLSLGNYLPLWLNLFFSPPVVLVFVLQFFRPLETIATCLFCGIIVDTLGGFALGYNMLLMLLMAFSLSAFNVFSGRIFWREQIFYVIAISFLYRLIGLITTFFFLGSKANIVFLPLAIGPWIDGAVSIIFFRTLKKTLILAKVMEQGDFFSNRLGFRP